MVLDRGRPVLLPLLAFVLALGIEAAAYAEDAGWLGVMLQPLSDEIKEAMDLEMGLQGVLVSDVVDDSPAEEYGLEDGDIIIMIGEDKVITVEEAVSAVKSHAPGEEVGVVVIRDGDKKKIVVKLGERGPEADVEKKMQMFDLQMPDLGHGYGHPLMEEQAYLGVRVAEISADLGEYFGVGAHEGVLVLEVIDDSPAEQADLKAGDVILQVDGKEITSPDGLVKYIGKSEPGEEVEVTYKRSRRTRTVTVELEKGPGPKMSWIGEYPGKPGKAFVLPPEAVKGMKGMKRIRIPKIDIEIPDIEGLEDLEDLEELEDIKVYRLDAEDLKQDLKELKKEMERLKEEIEKLKKS